MVDAAVLLLLLLLFWEWVTLLVLQWAAWYDSRVLYSFLYCFYRNQHSVCCCTVYMYCTVLYVLGHTARCMSHVSYSSRLVLFRVTPQMACRLL